MIVMAISGRRGVRLNYVGSMTEQVIEMFAMLSSVFSNHWVLANFLFDKAQRAWKAHPL
jgi:hypothetical protein